MYCAEGDGLYTFRALNVENAELLHCPKCGALKFRVSVSFGGAPDAALRRASAMHGFHWNEEEVRVTGTFSGKLLGIVRKLEHEKFEELTEGELLEIESYLGGLDPEVTAEIRSLTRGRNR